MLEKSPSTDLKDQVLLITGATRGIGLTIARAAAAEGARIVLIGKTATPHPRLEGTLTTAQEEVEAAGGEALALQCDIRDETAVQASVAKAVAHFGGIDILVNNASAIQLSDTITTSMKRFDLMHQVNMRGTFACGQACLPYLKDSERGGKILTLSPPLNMEPQYFGPHLAYSMAKFGM
ncbi:MAG: SDR family oxidoreductase, partial [Polyangiaceae bacterium]|nr:SDR family oxidoreductase [Polyangiaceae bacterium]